ncbi:MAG: histidine phosphatase family protein [Marinospirillum sp.]|uniref:histidine phosphatase family protein n=1 Tax=Marinospirillum sp. TaxID=2183934 RepID=UPI0019FC170D|nr:histidine phosphatase family protein [Marinospirillum sp.]MBE0505965.1 histidine phosphatase family protein [Marinospirillum sp.]
MAIYFMRHAQTPGNAANLWVGRKDEGLTLTGIVELERQLEKIIDVQFSGIYCSPLERARKTAEIAKKALGIGSEVQVVDALMERDFGNFEGMPKTTANRQALEGDDSVESSKALALRIEPFFHQIMKEEAHHLVISHSAVFRCLMQGPYTSIPMRSSLENAETVILSSINH